MVFDTAFRGAKTPGVFLAETCQVGVTHFLSWASKKENASKRKKTPEYTLERVSSGHLRKQKGFGPFEILEFSFLVSF